MAKRGRSLFSLIASQLEGSCKSPLIEQVSVMVLGLLIKEKGLSYAASPTSGLTAILKMYYYKIFYIV